MEKKVWGWLALAAVVVLVVVFAMKGGNTPTVVDDTSPIKVGGLASLTGEAAVYGISAQRGATMAIEEINAAGGVNGRMLEAIWEDGKCNGTDATTAVQKLLNVDGVKFIFGGLCSSETLAAAQLTQPARALLFSAGSSSPDITTAGDLVFRDYPSDALQGKVMASYAFNTLHAKTSAVISEKTDYAQGLRGVFTSTMSDVGGSVVFDETYDTGETDFRTMATKMHDADPDAVFVVPQTFSAGKLILKQIRDAGYEGKVMMSETILDHAGIAEDAPLFEGIISDELAVDFENPKTKAFMDAYTVKYGTSPEFPGFTAGSYDSVYLVVEAMKAGNMTPDAVAEYLNTKVKDWQGAVGTINFDENGDVILSLGLRKVEGGELVNLGSFAP